MDNLLDHEADEILLKKFEEFLMERESLLTKREKMVYEREKLIKERELKFNKSGEDDILNKREKLVSDREDLAQEREYILYCREAMLYEREIKLSQYVGFREDQIDEQLPGFFPERLKIVSNFEKRQSDKNVELTEKDFNILGLDITDPYDEKDIEYIKTLQGNYNEIMKNAHYYLKLSYASK